MWYSPLGDGKVCTLSMLLRAADSQQGDAEMDSTTTQEKAMTTHPNANMPARDKPWHATVLGLPALASPPVATLAGSHIAPAQVTIKAG